MKRLWFIILPALLACRPCAARDAGTTAANFLKLGIGPRAVALGDAQAGVADDVYASYWNPAGLAQLATPQAGFVHTQYVEDITAQYVAYAHPHPRWGSFSGSFTHLGIGAFDAYDASGQRAGSVDAGDSSLALSYARPFWKDRRLESSLSAGVTGRYIHQKLDSVTATAMAADVGLHWVPGRRFGSFLRGWRAGAVLRNLGTSVKFDRESFPLPRSFTTGVAWSGEIRGESVTAAVDMTQPNDGDPTLGGGVEVWTLGRLALRGGWSNRGDLGDGWRAGAGIRLNIVQVDYAFAGLDEFGGTHRIGLTLHLGNPSPSSEVQAQDWYEKGVKNFRRSRYTEAIVDFNKALEIDPTHPKALEMMDQTHEKLKAENPL